jgi:hypothetical protein
MADLTYRCSHPLSALVRTSDACEYLTDKKRANMNSLELKTIIADTCNCKTTVKIFKMKKKKKLFPSLKVSIDKPVPSHLSHVKCCYGSRPITHQETTLDCHCCTSVVVQSQMR